MKVVIDDESRFFHSEMPGNDGFYTQNKVNTRCAQKEKYEQKLLAINVEVHSRLFFAPSKGNVKSNVYRK